MSHYMYRYQPSPYTRQVHAIEPIRVLHQLMVANAALNGLHHVHPHLVFAGASSSSRPAEGMLAADPDFTDPSNYGALGWVAGTTLAT
jgi:hypothetical protein